MKIVWSFLFAVVLVGGSCASSVGKRSYNQQTPQYPGPPARPIFPPGPHSFVSSVPLFLPVYGQQQQPQPPQSQYRPPQFRQQQPQISAYPERGSSWPPTSYTPQQPPPQIQSGDRGQQPQQLYHAPGPVTTQYKVSVSSPNPQYQQQLPQIPAAPTVPAIPAIYSRPQQQPQQQQQLPQQQPQQQQQQQQQPQQYSESKSQYSVQTGNHLLSKITFSTAPAPPNPYPRPSQYHPSPSPGPAEVPKSGAYGPGEAIRTTSAPGYYDTAPAPAPVPAPVITVIQSPIQSAPVQPNEPQSVYTPAVPQIPVPQYPEPPLQPLQPEPQLPQYPQQLPAGRGGELPGQLSVVSYTIHSPPAPATPLPAAVAVFSAEQVHATLSNSAANSYATPAPTNSYSVQPVPATTAKPLYVVQQQQQLQENSGSSYGRQSAPKPGSSFSYTIGNNGYSGQQQQQEQHVAIYSSYSQPPETTPSPSAAAYSSGGGEHSSGGAYAPPLQPTTTTAAPVTYAPPTYTTYSPPTPAPSPPTLVRETSYTSYGGSQQYSSASSSGSGQSQYQSQSNYEIPASPGPAQTEAPTASTYSSQGSQSSAIGMSSYNSNLPSYSAPEPPRMPPVYSMDSQSYITPVQYSITSPAYSSPPPSSYSASPSSSYSTGTGEGYNTYNNYKSNEGDSKILSLHHNIQSNGQSDIAYETSNGILVSEETEVVKPVDGVRTPDGAIDYNCGTIVKRGKFSWISPEGQRYEVKYVADALGFRPSGEHLPTSPPSPY